MNVCEEKKQQKNDRGKARGVDERGNDNIEITFSIAAAQESAKPDRNGKPEKKRVVAVFASAKTQLIVCYRRCDPLHDRGAEGAIGSASAAVAERCGQWHQRHCRCKSRRRDHPIAPKIAA